MADIIIIMDMSSSVGNLSQNYISGLNTIIETQKRLNPDIRLSLITFNHVSTVHFFRFPITSLLPLPLDFIRPTGTTALYDTVMTVCNLEKENTNRILCVIMTDGEDTCSRIHSTIVARHINYLKHQNWSFLFLGPENYGLGIGIDTCILYDMTPSSIKRASHAVNVAISKVCASLTGEQNILSQQDLQLDVRDLSDILNDMKI